MRLLSWLGGKNPSSPRSQRKCAARRTSAAVLLSIDTLEARSLPSFASPVNYDVGSNPQAMVAADFTGDGIPDLAVANYTDSTVSVLPGNGNGTFGAATNSRTDTDSGAGTGPRSLAVGDFDGDGNLDIVTVNNGDVSVLLGSGDGTFLLKGTVGLPAVSPPGSPGDLAQTPLSVAVGDITGDGVLDVTVTGSTSFIIRNGPSSGYDSYGYPISYYTYDTHNNGHVNVLIGDGSGDFTAPDAAGVQLLEGAYPISVVFDQLDGAPGLDLAVADYDGGAVRVLSGNDDGTFDAAMSYSTGGYPTSVLTGDVNGDGIRDLITADYYGASVLLGNGSAGVGDGTFQTARSTSLDSYVASLAVGDINDDGKLDLVSSSNIFTQTGDYWSGYSGYNTGRVNVLLGYGDGTFADATGRDLDAGIYATGLAVADFDGDDLPDVALANGDADYVSVLLNAGDWVLPAKLSINDVTVTEGDTGTVSVTFTVTRSGNLDGTVTVNYTTADGGALAGSDYVATSGKLTFGPGVATQAITVLVKGDLTDEFDQGFFVNLSDASGAVIKDGRGEGTILDNDPAPTATITSKVSAKEGHNSGTTKYNFTVTLSAPSEKEVRVSYATADGTATTADGDYVATSGTLVFSPGQTTKNIPVTVKGDKKKETDETFSVNLTGATNAAIAVSRGIGEILDDDTPAKRGKR